MKDKNTIVLLDVDGTLTESRKPIQKRMLLALHHLAKKTEIGFLTGSSMEYIKEQLWPALNDAVIRDNCHLFPCNGTEHLIPHGETSFDLNFKSLSKEVMRKKIGDANFYKIMKEICKLQNKILLENPSLPLTGNFVQNRTSMINWCPIGRNANDKERKIFSSIDKTFKIRDNFLPLLAETADKIGLSVKLGGDTSFDIYPKGWDKTYVFNHFDVSQWDFWFVGDRCTETGNDFEIYNALKPQNRAFETSGPEETIDLIDWYILPEFLEND